MNSPLTNLIIALVVCIAASIGYGVWYTAIATKSTAVANLESRIVTKTQTASRIASARAALTEIAGDESIVQSHFVSKTGVVAFIDDLEARGKAQGVIMSVLSVSTGGAPTRPTLVLTLAIKGTFDAVMRTIGSIEYAPYDISILGLSLGQDASNSWHADLKLLIGSISENETISQNGSDASGTTIL